MTIELHKVTVRELVKGYVDGTFEVMDGPHRAVVEGRQDRTGEPSDALPPVQRPQKRQVLLFRLAFHAEYGFLKCFQIVIPLAVHRIVIYNIAYPFQGGNRLWMRSSTKVRLCCNTHIL